MRRKKEQEPVYIWIQGERWERGEWERAQSLAIAITGTDIQLIDQLTRHCCDQRKGRYSLYGTDWAEGERCLRLVRDLYERAGAADALQDSPQGVPLTVAEISPIEALREQLQRCSSHSLSGHRDPMLGKADDLLNKLHFLVGRAKATSGAAGVTVFQAEQAEPGRVQLPAAR